MSETHLFDARDRLFRIRKDLLDQIAGLHQAHYTAVCQKRDMLAPEFASRQELRERIDNLEAHVAVLDCYLGTGVSPRITAEQFGQLLHEVAQEARASWQAIPRTEIRFAVNANGHVTSHRTRHGTLSEAVADLRAIAALLATEIAATESLAAAAGATE